MDSHDLCNPHASSDPWTPTRLLDLGNNNDSSESIRLIITDPSPNSGNELSLASYATLSHCWGTNEFLKLTKGTLDKLCNGFELKDMPKTFQEAIVVCRALQIRYIWIDSLCIIQDEDDLSDWTREASLMHKVYSRSHLNISASDARAGSQGLFRTRNASVVEQMRIKATLLNDCGVLETKYYVIEDPVYWWAKVTDSYIHTRGWVFQERLMALRVLHFIRDQLAWECKEKSACEKYPEHIPFAFLEEVNYKQHLAYENLTAEAANRECVSQDIETAHLTWNYLVSAYSQTKLTRPSDKLVAISGEAKALASLTRDGYIAGMWRRILDHQLLWIVLNTDGEASSRNREYCAPSWSWASMSTMVNLLNDRFDPPDIRIHIEQVNMTYVTDDPTGQVASAFIDLQGELRPMSMRYDVVSRNWYATLHRYHTEIFYGGLKWSDEFDAEMQPTTGVDAGNQLFYMNFVVSETRVMAMLLRLVDEEAGTFERWGIIDANQKRPVRAYDDIRAALLADLDEEVKEKLPCLRYEGGKHTIRFI